MFKLATAFCKRLNVTELVTDVPVYGSIAGNVPHFFFNIVLLDSARLIL